MKKIIIAMAFFVFGSLAKAQIECTAQSTRMIEVNLVSCATPESFALPKYNYTSQFGEGIEYKKEFTVKGYVTAATGNPIKLNSPLKLQADLMFDANFIKPEFIKAEGILNVGGFKLHEAQVSRAYVGNAAAVPSMHVPYVLPEAKIAVLKTDALNCEFTQGKALAHVSCEIERIDQGQYDCNCNYKLAE